MRFRAMVHPTGALLVVSGCLAPRLGAAPDWPMWLQNPTHTPACEMEATGVLQTDWRIPCGGLFGSPVVYQGGVYFASRDGKIYAIDDATGETRWVVQVIEPGTELPDPSAKPDEFWRRYERGFLGTPAVDDRFVYVGGLDGVCRALDCGTGAVAWSQDLLGPISDSPLLTPESVVIGTRLGELFALERGKGEPRWDYSAGAPINSSAAFAEGLVVVGTGRGVAAIDASTGNATWEAAFTDGAKCDASPVIADGRVYAASWSGKVAALNLADGQVLWEQQVGDRPIFAAPTVAAGKVFVATTGGAIAALDAVTGVSLWKGQLQGGAAYPAPLPCGPVLVTAANSSCLEVFEIDSGRRVSQVPLATHPLIHGTPTFTDTAIYLPSEALSGNPRGEVQKLHFGPYQPRGETLKSREAVTVICLELGLIVLGDTEKYNGWGMVRLRPTVETVAFNRLRALGGITDPWAWRYADLTRYQLAALLHKLLWDPNALGAGLPAVTPARLADAERFPHWCFDTPELVVGAGLMQAKDGSFAGHDLVTWSELRKTVERIKELLPETPR